MFYHGWDPTCLGDIRLLVLKMTSLRPVQWGTGSFRVLYLAHCCFLLPFGVLVCSFNVTYVTDLQLYVPLTIGNCIDLSKLEACLSAISSWLSDNFLLLNTDKTDLMVTGPQNFKYLSQNFSLKIDDYVINCGDKVRCVVWHSALLWVPFERDNNDCLLPPKEHQLKQQQLKSGMFYHWTLQRYLSMHLCLCTLIIVKLFFLGYWRKVLEVCKWYKMQLLAF